MPDDIDIDWDALEYKIENGLTIDHETVVALYHLAKAAHGGNKAEPASESYDDDQPSANKPKAAATPAYRAPTPPYRAPAAPAKKK